MVPMDGMDGTLNMEEDVQKNMEKNSNLCGEWKEAYR